ncbi:MAG: hypothetical protein R2838_08760 [Caldilineaceae bacterium]
MSRLLRPRPNAMEQEGGSCSAGYTLIGGPQSISGGSSWKKLLTMCFCPRPGRSHTAIWWRWKRRRTSYSMTRTFRLDISPHNERPGFDAIVRQYNYDAGFEVEYGGA